MNITESLSARARETPDAPAVLTADASLSFAELDRAVSWTAASFRKAGLVLGDIAGIDLSNQAQHLVTSLALVRLGVGQFAFHVGDPPQLRGELTRRLKIVATVSDKSTETDTQTPVIDPPPGSLRRFGYACGWVVQTTPSGEPVHWHNGSVETFYASVSLYPESNLAVVCAMNIGNGDAVAKKLTEAIYRRRRDSARNAR